VAIRPASVSIDEIITATGLREIPACNPMLVKTSPQNQREKHFTERKTAKAGRFSTGGL